MVPSLAAQAHSARIGSVINSVINTAALDFKDLSAIAVTKGPGLAGCLAVGLQAAKDIVRLHKNLSLVAVNHMEGHALVPRLDNPSISFPFLTLLISGGHTQLVVCKQVGDYAMLGDSLDDAVGECIDKVARALNLPFRGGGGRAIESFAAIGVVSDEFELQVPLKHTKNCDFSFSGLKSACLNLLAKHPDITTNDTKKANFAATFQHTITLHLSDRVRRGARWCRLNIPQVKHLVLSGGVACNKAIRAALDNVAASEGLLLCAPPPALCTDNGVMIAWAGIENLLAQKGLVTDLDSLRFVPRWPLDSSGTDYFPGTHMLHNKTKWEKSAAQTKAAIAEGDKRPHLFFSLARDLSRLQNYSEALNICNEGLSVREI